MRMWRLPAFVALLLGCASQTDPPQPAPDGEQATPKISFDEDTGYVDPLIPPIQFDPPEETRLILLPPDAEKISLSPKSVVPYLAHVDLSESDFSHDDRAHFHAHGEEVCASGCAASRHPTPELTVPEFHRLTLDYSRGPISEENAALEALLFYGRQSSALLGQFGPGPLDSERVAFLQNELRTTHALISFRVVDDEGIVRTWMPPTKVPFDRRHVFDMETERLPPLETSGTVKRVGLHHLWTRI